MRGPVLVFGFAEQIAGIGECRYPLAVHEFRIPPDMIDMLVAKKVDGIVIAGVGNGNFNKAYMDAVKRAVAAGVIICRASRTPSGRVVLHDEINDEELGTIVSDDLTPQKARILLMLGLTKTKDKKQLQDLFFKY